MDNALRSPRYVITATFLSRRNVRAFSYKKNPASRNLDPTQLIRQPCNPVSKAKFTWPVGDRINGVSLFNVFSQQVAALHVRQR